MLEHQLKAKKKDEITIHPDHFIDTPGGMTLYLGSSSKFMWTTNFHFLEASILTFPKPYEREAYYQVDLSIVGKKRK